MSYRAHGDLRPSGAPSARHPHAPCSAVAAPVRRRRPGVFGAGLVLVGLLLAGPALALITTGWTTNGSASASATVNGITVTLTGQADQAYSAGAFNSSGWWSDPYGGGVNGGPSLTMVYDSAGTRNYVFTFSKAVDNPVLHVDRLGGYYDNNRPNGTRWTLTGFTAAGGSVVLERLSGNAQFTVTPAQNRFARATSGTFGGTGSSECLSTSNGTACGSVRFNGTGITRLTFAVEMAGDRGAGDELELRWSFDGAKVVVRKQSAGGTGTFGITASNALSQAFNLVTTAQNVPVASNAYPLTNHAAAITLTESSVPSGYVLLAAACTDQNGATVAATVDAAARQVTIPPANYRANQTITCTLSNAAPATLALAKTWANAAVNDSATLSGSGGTNTATLASVANSAAETDTGAAVKVAPGDVVTLSETLGAGNARPYTASAWTCTGGKLSGNMLTLTDAHAGQAIVCSITNSGRATDVSVVKSAAAGRVNSGQLTNFTVVVSNAGPLAADGAMVSDTPGAGLDCPASGNPITCSASGGAACPGAASLPGLVGAGVAVPTLPVGGTVTFTVPCQVTASGL